MEGPPPSTSPFPSGPHLHHSQAPHLQARQHRPTRVQGLALGLLRPTLLGVHAHGGADRQSPRLLRHDQEQSSLRRVLLFPFRGYQRRAPMPRVLIGRSQGSMVSLFLSRAFPHQRTYAGGPLQPQGGVEHGCSELS